MKFNRLQLLVSVLTCLIYYFITYNFGVPSGFVLIAGMCVGQLNCVAWNP